MIVPLLCSYDLQSFLSLEKCDSWHRGIIKCFIRNHLCAETEFYSWFSLHVVCCGIILYLAEVDVGGQSSRSINFIIILYSLFIISIPVETIMKRREHELCGVQTSWNCRLEKDWLNIGGWRWGWVGGWFFLESRLVLNGVFEKLRIRASHGQLQITSTALGGTINGVG